MSSKDHATGRPSIIYSIAVLIALAAFVAGVVIAVIGLGKPTAVTLEGQGVTIKTTSIGLIIMVVGAALTSVLIVNKPADITMADRETPPAPGDERARWLRYVAFAATGVGVVLLIVSLATE